MKKVAFAVKKRLVREFYQMVPSYALKMDLYNKKYDMAYDEKLWKTFMDVSWCRNSSALFYKRRYFAAWAKVVLKVNVDYPQ